MNMKQWLHQNLTTQLQDNTRCESKDREKEESQTYLAKLSVSCLFQFVQVFPSEEFL